MLTARVGIGTAEHPTPAGRFYIRNRLTSYRSPSYGPLAFGTSARSAVLTDWPAGGYVGIHGTDRPDLLPGRVSHGCIRMRNADVLRLGTADAGGHAGDGPVIARAALLGLVAFLLPAGIGQAQDTGGAGERVRPPAELTEEYPLGGERLCCGSDPGASGPRSTSAEPVPPRGSPFAAALRAGAARDSGGPDSLAVYARGAPGGAYGYSIDVRPRPRRSVPPLALTLLRPLFRYHYRRDAWILRSVGDRVGPVLRPRDHPVEAHAEPPAPPRRTGRFERTEPAASAPVRKRETARRS